VILKSYEAVYEKGQFEWLGDAPTVEKARVVITIIEEMPIQNHRRQPPPELKGSVAWKGAPFDPEMSDEEWDATFYRTVRQILGAPEAFK